LSIATSESGTLSRFGSDSWNRNEFTRPRWMGRLANSSARPSWLAQASRTSVL
jgi:hypothetical protein